MEHLTSWSAYTVSSRTVTQRRRCWDSSARVGMMRPEGLFHHSDIPRHYTDCKQGPVFEPWVTLTRDIKSRNFTVLSET